MNIEGDERLPQLSIASAGDGGKREVPADESMAPSLERRRFLKNVGFVTAGAITGPVLFQGCGGGGGGSQAQAAPRPGAGGSNGGVSTGTSGYDDQVPAPAVPPEILQPAAAHVPVLKFDDNHVSHLLSIDFRSEADLLTLNDIYSQGAYIATGALTFDSHRGVQAEDYTSGLRIDLSRVLAQDVRLALAEEGQFTIELESSRIADPWLLNEYLDRYTIARRDPGVLPASAGDYPFAELRGLCRLIAEDGIGGPVVDGPAPESPSGLATRANNLGIRLHNSSAQAMQVGIHSAVHGEFCAVTVAWRAWNRFTVYIDGVPHFLAGPDAVGPYGATVSQDSFTTNDVSPSLAARNLIELFFGRAGVRIRRIVLGAQAPVFETHPLFREWASFGDSFTHRGGYSNSKFAVRDLWDAEHIYYFMRRLAQYGYRTGWCWNNSLGGGSHLKTASRSLWNNGGVSDLTSLMNLSPSFVMMAASHNDAAYIGRGGAPESAEYQRRLALVKADFLEHVQVILTGSSPDWSAVLPAGDARIGIISSPVSPRAPGWQDSESQAQRDLNRFVIEEVPEWVLANLGEAYRARVATFDVATLFGEYPLGSHPLFEQSGTGVHPNWWGGDLLNYGWWQCALQLINA